MDAAKACSRMKRPILLSEKMSDEEDLEELRLDDLIRFFESPARPFSRKDGYEPVGRRSSAHECSLLIWVILKSMQWDRYLALPGIGGRRRFLALQERRRTSSGKSQRFGTMSQSGRPVHRAGKVERRKEEPVLIDEE